MMNIRYHLIIGIKGKRPDDFANHKLPVYINSNLYFNKAKAFNREIDKFENRKFVPKISIEKKKIAII